MACLLCDQNSGETRPQHSTAQHSTAQPSHVTRSSTAQHSGVTRSSSVAHLNLIGPATALLGQVPSSLTLLTGV